MSLRCSLALCRLLCVTPALVGAFVLSPAARAEAAKPAAAKPPAASPAAAMPAAASPPAAAHKIDKAEAKSILKRAEEIRCLEKAEVAVELSNLDGKMKVVYQLKILNSTQRRAYIEFLAPAEERGRKMLAQGRNYWSTFPDSKRIVTISKREMIGNSAFAMGDIFQLDAEEDYDPETAVRETVDGVPLIMLDLKGKNEDVPYARIKYWVEEKGYFPVRAEFYGLSGKMLKALTVESRKEIGGLVRPEVSRMDDKVTKGHVSFWRTTAMTARDIPDTVFTKDYLKNRN
jgi:outer membrane lipoprotein-sorting protein